MNLIRLPHLLLATLLLLLLPRLGWSQGVTTAAMSGTITDSKGEALPGATVVAVHTPTNTTYGSSTNADGRFNIQGMRVGGPYTVKVTFVGYQDVSREITSLTLAENFRLDVKLSQSATALGEVVVAAPNQNNVINADRTGAATTVRREQIERLPTINRSFDDVTRLTPQASGGAGNVSFGGRNNLYNNITIDGAIFNNSFGLSGNVGGQTNAQPISLDAIDQIQVSLAPFDVRQGSFTGAGINAVTRSGTNKVQGSVYGFYRNQDLVGKKVGSLEQAFGEFNLKNYGFRLGGPLVKDKLFFFLNGEEETRTEPFSQFIANRPGVTAAPSSTSTTSRVLGNDLDILGNFLQTNYGYNPGGYENVSQRTYSKKATAKLDWNINANNRFNFKYNYLRSYRDAVPSTSGALANGRNPNQFGLPFFSSFYTINNNLDSYIAELNSTIGGRFANNLTAGYFKGRDFRTSPGGNPFPLVDIGDATARTVAGGNVGSVNQLTSFGYEPFTANNILNTDTYQFGDNFTAYLGKHNVTVGTYSELYKFSNGFAPNYYGAYQFNGLDDFYAAAITPTAPNGYTRDANGNPVANPASATPGLPQRYQLQYSAVPGGAFPFAVTKAAQVGLYVQDEYSPISNLKITVGLRGDLPIIFSDIARNETAANLVFRDGQRIETDRQPKRTVLFSPRVGFNWDVNDDKKTQVRGGTGVFTGRIPFVWLSNQAGNNGVLFGSFDRNGAAIANTPVANRNFFSPSVDAYRPEGAAANASYNLAVTATDFKFPQVFRSNLAVDQELPGGIVATVEALYTKDLNAVYFQNINLPQPTSRAVGADTRPIFYTFNNLNTTGANAGLYTPGNITVGGQSVPSAFQNNRIYNGPNGNGSGATVASPVITDAILLNNTKKGYQYSITGQLQKSFSNGLFAQIAYTYSDARSVNDGGSIAQSSWRGREVSGDPNADVLGYSQYFAQHRVVGAVSYRATYLKHLNTTISAFYQASPAGRYSYVYGGDVNGDNAGGNNDLLYVPRNQSEVQLRDQTFFGGTAQSFVYTANQQWTDLNTFIDQDSYLSKRRGEYAERNGAQAQWLRQLDVRVLQDIFANIGESKNTLQFSVDIFNVGNLLNSNWGTLRQVNRTNVLAFQGYDQQGRPNFTYPYLTAPTRTVNADNSVSVSQGVPLTNTFRDNTGINSRWQMQIGLRYIFN